MKYLHSILSFFKTLARPFPVRDWYLALGVSSMVALALIALSVYLFIGIQSGAIIAPKGGDAPPALGVSRDSLSKTVEAYNARVLNFNAKNYTTPDVSDPSR